MKYPAGVWMSAKERRKGKDSLERVMGVARMWHMRKCVPANGQSVRDPASGAPRAGLRMPKRQQGMEDSTREAASAWRDFLLDRRENAKSMTSAQLRGDQRASLTTSTDGREEERRSGRGRCDWGGKRTTVQSGQKRQGDCEAGLAKPLPFAHLCCVKLTTKTAFPLCGTECRKPIGWRHGVGHLTTALAGELLRKEWAKRVTMRGNALKCIKQQSS